MDVVKVLLCKGDTIVALSSIEMNILANLKIEEREIRYANGNAQHRWDLNDNEMIVVEKWIKSRITELENKK